MIEINNLTTSSIDIDFLKKVAQEVLAGESKKESNLSIALINPGKMREINKRYRGESRATDVLAFPELKIGSLKKIRALGEIIICPQEVKKNAKIHSTNFETELTRVLIHGILRLFGYDHEKNEREAKILEEKEELYLNLIF